MRDIRLHLISGREDESGRFLASVARKDDEPFPIRSFDTEAETREFLSQLATALESRPVVRPVVLEKFGEPTTYCVPRDRRQEKKWLSVAAIGISLLALLLAIASLAPR